ncbi:MAG: PHP domain-containing protein [Clostridia bacterium]|nr:PHP domain-containing protein [Clostridia bacterium]
MYKYETHMHTFPVSGCAKVSAEEALDFYAKAGYDGVFLTNHFPDGFSNNESVEEQTKALEFYFSDYEKAKAKGKEIGLKVFLGIETSLGGTDFLVYGLSKEWFMSHREFDRMKMSEKLLFLRENGAYIVQAHPFREAGYIDHLRLFPRHVDAVEVINACRTDFENQMAQIYAENYALPCFAGSDNHTGKERPTLAGMCAKRPIADEADFIRAMRAGELEMFTADNRKE